MLGFKGNEDQKQWVQDQHAINQKREARLTDYAHAMSLVAEQKAKIADVSAVAGLDNLLAGLKEQSEKYSGRKR